MSGFTPLPNYVYELAPSLTEAELRVLLYLYRRIAGWHKEADQISLSQFQAGTGLTSKQLVPLPDKRLVPEADRALVPQADTQKKEEIKAKDRKAWEAALVRLQGMMSAPNYQTFCADLELVTLTATTLIIRAPSAYVATTLRQKWLPLIQKALGRPGAGVLIRVIMRPAYPLWRRGRPGKSPAGNCSRSHCDASR
jgi:hypothetical protein